MENDALIKKLREIKKLADDCLDSLSEESGTKFKKAVRKTDKKSTTSDNYIVDIVNTIKNCDESDSIEEKILNSTSETGRILLPFYIANKYIGGHELTSGNIEKITSELGVRVKIQNVSNAITKSLHKYLEGKETRKKGKAGLYKLNRKGVQYFESLLKTNEKQ